MLTMVEGESKQKHNVCKSNQSGHLSRRRMVGFNIRYFAARTLDTYIYVRVE